MTGKLKNLIITLSLGVLIYLVSSANTLVAEDAENEVRDKYAGATVSVEASVVIIEPEALEEITDDLDTQNLNSIPLEKIMQIIREDEGGEMISAVKLAVGNKSEAEMKTEENADENVEENRKISDEESGTRESGTREKREKHVSFRVVPTIIDMNRIAVSFDFKQIASRSALISESEAEVQEEKVTEFEVSSELVLRPGQPRIVGASKKDEVIFLIMSVDI